MNNYQQNLIEEGKNLAQTLDFLKKELKMKQEMLFSRKSNLLVSGKDMWNNGAHSPIEFEDIDQGINFDNVVEMNQYLQEVNQQTRSYNSALKLVEKYKRMIKSPYFGRFDFIEEGFGKKEKIYIGLNTVIDPDTKDILIYDWRAPISSIFYQHELGRASYKAPLDNIMGEVLLKRQYKIQDSELKYFFDCNIKIDDEILQEVLCQNSSTKMKKIIETIQKDQDIIVRDTENQLLIVQGAAGSGKTSIALHRIAFMLYHGLNANLNSKNIIIISPNAIFSKYISSVLPELGEENVRQIIFEDYVIGILKEKGKVETRNEQLECLINSSNSQDIKIKSQGIDFKGSRLFVEILNRLIHYYEHSMIEFEDIYYNGKTIETKQQLKNMFLDNKIDMPMARRLKRIENMMLKKVHPLRNEKVDKIEKLIQIMSEHQFQIKSFSRLLSLKQSKVFLSRLRSFTEVDYYEVYYSLFKEKGLLSKLSEGLELPKDIEGIIAATKNNLENGKISYEDCAPLLYLKLKIEGNDLFTDIKQAVIDEAQDYSPLQYEVFKLLFKNANYTVLGDVNQAMEKDVEVSLYDIISKVFNKKKSAKIFLNKSYRSTFEISTFAQKLLNKNQGIVAFERYETEPVIVSKDTLEEMNVTVVEDVNSYIKEGFESIAIICKTSVEAEKLYNKLKNSISNLKILKSSEEEIEEGIMIIPSYMAKGLEFDVVLVYDVSKENYSSEIDRRLLYIACTRALHRLALYHTGKRSEFL